jgi:hypothetical protein
MIIALSIATIVLAFTPEQEPDGPRLAAILSARHDKLRDVEIVCEGTVQFVDAEDPDQSKRASLDRTFRTDYAYRSRDGATYLDARLRPRGPGRPQDQTLIALPGNGHEKAVASPDQKDGAVRGVREPARIESAAVSGSPERILDFGSWREFIRKPAIWKVRSLGWEAIDGHRCAHFEVDDNPGSMSRRHIWVDIERDSNILKEEFYHDDNLWFRIDKVELVRFPLPAGGMVWFPVRGEYSSFLNGSVFKATPVLRETYNLVSGPLRLNQGLGDEKFLWTRKGNKTIAPDLDDAKQDSPRPR